MRANFLRDASVSQFALFVRYAKFAAFFAPCLTQLFVPIYKDPSWHGTEQIMTLI